MNKESFKKSGGHLAIISFVFIVASLLVLTQAVPPPKIMQNEQGFSYIGWGDNVIVTATEAVPTAVYPANESFITKTQPTLLFTLTNSTGSLNYTVYTGNLSTDVTHYLSNDSFVGNGTYHADYYNATGYYVEYYWRVSVNDSFYWTNETYHFSVVHDGGMVPARSPLAIVGVMALFIALGIFLFIFVMKRRKENE